MSDHFFLQLGRDFFKKENLFPGFAKAVCLPPRRFPPSFSLETEDFWCGGYLASYSGKLNPERIAATCQTADWNLFSRNSDDYLILFYSKRRNKLHLLVGQSGAFPGYFAVLEDKFVASTDFYEVRKRIDKLSLNLDSAAEYLFTEYSGLATEETIAKEIFQLPPGCRLTLSADFSWQITSLVDLAGFRSQPPPAYTSLENFADDFVVLFEKVVKERLNLVKSYPWASDLSSGFDIALVCYALKKASGRAFACLSRLSTLSPGDAVLPVMEDFVRQHGLDLKTLDSDKFYPFSTPEGLDWTATHFFPAMHGLELYQSYVQFIAQNGYQIIFQGNGGDEIYHSYHINDLSRFPIQGEYFLTIGMLKEGLDKLFTDKGLDWLADKKRFINRPYYPSILSTSTTIGRFYFPLYWPVGVWPIEPYADLRLVQLARGIPLDKDAKPPTKHQLWRHRQDIFVPSQFRPKEHMAAHMSQFVNQRKDFVISLLENSVLGKLKLVKATRIIDNLRRGRESIYQDKLTVLLHNILRLEYFLQKNNVDYSV